MPIEVLKGPYCWKQDEAKSCDHFSNEGGHSICDLDFYPLKTTPEGFILKPEDCKCLEQIKNQKQKR